MTCTKVVGVLLLPASFVAHDGADKDSGYVVSRVWWVLFVVYALLASVAFRPSSGGAFGVVVVINIVLAVGLPIAACLRQCWARSTSNTPVQEPGDASPKGTSRFVQADGDLALSTGDKIFLWVQALQLGALPFDSHSVVDRNPFRFINADVSEIDTAGTIVAVVLGIGLWLAVGAQYMGKQVSEVTVWPPSSFRHTLTQLSPVRHAMSLLYIPVVVALARPQRCSFSEGGDCWSGLDVVLQWSGMVMLGAVAVLYGVVLCGSRTLLYGLYHVLLLAAVFGAVLLRYTAGVFGPLVAFAFATLGLCVLAYNAKLPNVCKVLTLQGAVLTLGVILAAASLDQWDSWWQWLLVGLGVSVALAAFLFVFLTPSSKPSTAPECTLPTPERTVAHAVEEGRGGKRHEPFNNTPFRPAPQASGNAGAPIAAPRSAPPLQPMCEEDPLSQREDMRPLDMVEDVMPAPDIGRRAAEDSDTASTVSSTHQTPMQKPAAPAEPVPAPRSSFNINDQLQEHAAKEEQFARVERVEVKTPPRKSGPAQLDADQDATAKAALEDEKKSAREIRNILKQLGATPKPSVERPAQEPATVAFENAPLPGVADKSDHRSAHPALLNISQKSMESSMMDTPASPTIFVSEEHITLPHADQGTPSPVETTPPPSASKQQMAGCWNACDDLEDEREYRKGGYHPTQRGEVFNDKYEALGKLGWGEFSVVWLAKIIGTDPPVFVAMKISKSGNEFRRAAVVERDIFSEINLKMSQSSSSSAYANYVARLVDSFDHVGPHGTHLVTVFEVLGPSLLKLVSEHDFRGIHSRIVKVVAKQVLMGLSLLHDDVGIVHCDVKPENILLATPGEKALVQMLKESDGRTGYDHNDIGTMVQALRGQHPAPQPGESVAEVLMKFYGVKVADLGTSRWKKSKYPIVTLQTREYRSPEVLLGHERVGPAVDIWSVACMVFELLTGDFLFDPKAHVDSDDKDSFHLSLFMQLLGDVPKEVLEKGTFTDHFYRKRDMKFQGTRLQSMPLLDLLLKHYKMPPAEAKLLHSFLRPMLEYNPNKRVTARAHLSHPWLEVSQ